MLMLQYENPYGVASHLQRQAFQMILNTLNLAENLRRSITLPMLYGVVYILIFSK